MWDAAVLFRATTNLPLYEAEFKNAGLPYLTVSGRGYYDRSEVQDLLSLLAALANPLDDLNLAACLRSPMFSLNDETLYQLRWHSPNGDLAESPIPLRAALSQPPHTSQAELVARAHDIMVSLWMLAGRVEIWSLLREALDTTSYEATLALYDGETGRQRVNVNKFLSLVRERNDVSIPGFLRRIRELKAREAREGEALGREHESGAVQLMSIHASKGLEYPVVIVANMGRKKGGGFGSPYLLHDPAFGLVCRVRDEHGDWQYDRMEEAERKRLLYVACTRAADLLILSGQFSNKGSWLTDALEAWYLDEDGPEEEIQIYEDFAIQVFRPMAPEELKQAAVDSIKPSVKLKTIPKIAQPLSPKAQPQPISVTHLEQLLSRENRDFPDIQPALWANQPAVNSTRAPGYLIGNIVHRALAHWDCLAYSEGDLIHLLESYAQREGIFSQALVDAVQRSYQMMRALKDHHIYQDIQNAQRRYHELTFTISADIGVLHGIIDLLYQDQSGAWHLMDWKTEWTPKADIEESAMRYLVQMAAYARAAQRTLQAHPDVVLCFLYPDAALYQVPDEMIVNAWSDMNKNNHLIY